MESLPVEVVGNILSHLGAARDVVIASTTCRKWQEAWRNHIHVLRFNSSDWPVYHELLPSTLEIIITQTIFQTKGLQYLSIIMDDVEEFSAAPVIAWLMYTRESLRQLHYNVRTTPSISMLDKCGRQKLEVLALSHNTIMGVDPCYQKFPCLKSLSLSYVSISALDLSLLLNNCPKIEILNLISLDIVMTDPQAMLDLSSSSLKDIYVKAISLDKFILEADGLEKLHLQDCTFDVFELVGKGMLKHLMIDDVSVIHIDIGESANDLEIVDVSNFTFMWAKFHHMISRSSKLRKLRLWAIVFEDDNEFIDIEKISSCFPRLSYLSLDYHLSEEALQCLQSSFVLDNVLVLELGWTVISDLFSTWVYGLLERCPRLRKLIIHGVISDTTCIQECRMLASFTSSMVRLMRKYMDVEVQFEYL